MAYLLRYGAEKEGLEVTADGFVKLKDLESANLLTDSSVAEILEEVETSISMRRIKRFEQRVSSLGEIQIRATYGRRMERVRNDEAPKTGGVRDHGFFSFSVHFMKVQRFGDCWTSL